MKLLEPYFLYAFLALAIPILIHLFSLQRHKTVYFSNVSFLRQLQQKKSNINKLQKLLLLLVRLLLLTAIILAFCEPYISNDQILSNEKKIIGVYIDNSFSMSANNDKGQLIEQAKNNARSVLDAHKSKDEFVFISNDLQGKHQKILDYKACLQAIDNTQIVPAVLKLHLVIDRFQSLIQNEKNSEAELYLISDYQKTSCPENFYEHSKELTTHLLPISSYPQTNLSVDTCFLETPNHTIGQQEWLIFKVSNNSDETIEKLSAKVFINGKQKALSTLKIEANSSTTAKLSYNNNTLGKQNGYIEISDATIVFDNRLYFNYEVQERTQVLSVFEEESNNSLKRLFSDSIFNYNQSAIGTLDYASLDNYNLIILEDVVAPTSGFINALRAYSIAGGSLLIYPSKNLNLSSFRVLAEALTIPKFSKLNNKKVQVSQLNKNHRVFDEVFEKQSFTTVYPEVSTYFSIEKNYLKSEESVLRLNTDEPFLNSYKNERGSVYLQTSPLNTSANTFEKNALFVPVLYNIATQSAKLETIYYTIGRDRIISLKKETNSENWRIVKEDFVILPEVRTFDHKIQINIQNTLKEAGFYTLDNGDQNSTVSFNFNRLESKLATWELEELKKNSAKYEHLNLWNKEGLELEKALKENRSGKPLWRLFILIALLCVVLESLLLKKWNKNAQKNREN